MEYAKDEVFQIRYNTRLDRLQIKEKGFFNWLRRMVKRHKLLTTVVISFTVFAVVNVVMIVSFMRILQGV